MAPGGVEPPHADSRFGPELREAETNRDDPVCRSGFCLIVAFVISADLGGSGGPAVAPMNVAAAALVQESGHAHGRDRTAGAVGRPPLPTTRSLISIAVLARRLIPVGVETRSQTPHLRAYCGGHAVSPPDRCRPERPEAPAGAWVAIEATRAGTSWRLRAASSSLAGTPRGRWSRR